MSYKISTSYNWYRTENEVMLIKTYYINGVAFTFDEIPEIAKQDPDIITQANDSMTYTPEDFFLKSFYLIDEECHPCLFELDIENPELLEELNS
jgi:hypothetical protein